MNGIMLLRLEGILQSWGTRSRWDTRDTSNLPTKSAVIGLIAGAMGVKRDDISIAQMGKELRMGVRVDSPGLWIEDYQTISGEKINADGTKRKSPIVSPRRYLQDASFLVALEGEKTIVDKCIAALSDPVWQIYLGRKCCVPTAPIYEKLNGRQFNSIEEALCEWDLSERVRNSHDSRENLIGEIEFDLPTVRELGKMKLLKKYSRRDVIVGNPARTYLSREAWLFSIPVPGGGE